jgi:transposase
MILNGLGFSNRRLYLVSQYFEHKPLEHLLGRRIKAEDLNDDCLGRTLDWLYEHDVTTLFAGIARKARQVFGIQSQQVHVDTTSFSVSGAYEAEPESEVAVSITYGYSRDHRADLKQWMLALATTQEADVPMFLRPLDGNSSDQVSIVAAVEALHEQLRAPEEEVSIYVADSGVYSQANMQRLNIAQIAWISRVPETSSSAREELASALGAQADWQVSPDGATRWCCRQVSLPQGQERWVIVSTKTSEQRAHATVQKQARRDQQSWAKRLWHLQARRFACEADAQAALSQTTKDLPPWFEVQSNCTAHAYYKGKGRPARDATPLQHRWQCQATLTVREDRLEAEERRRACFMVGTNILDTTQLSDWDLVTTYKQQGGVERGFRFLKDPLFLASSVFVKKPSRIVALSLIMVLCLLVYRLAEYRLRTRLSETGQRLPNQLKKPTATPTMRWVFQCFEGIDLLLIHSAAGITSLVLHLQPFHELVLRLLGPPYQKFYKLSP